MKKWTFLFVVLALASCRKFDPEMAQNNSVSSDMFAGSVAPTNFSWNTALETEYRLDFDVAQAQQAGVIELLDNNYNPIISLYKKAGQSSLNFKSRITSNVDSVYVYSKKLKILHQIPVGEARIDLSLDVSTKKTEAYLYSNFLKSSSCGSGCDLVKSGSESDITVDDKSTLCLTGSMNGELEIKGNGTIYICGNANISKLKTKSSNQVIVVSGSGRLTINKLDIPSTLTLINYGTVNIGDDFSCAGFFENHGNLTIASKANFKSAAHAINLGSITINDETNIHSEFLNSGEFKVTGDVHINGESDFQNSCGLIVQGDLRVAGDLINNGYVDVLGETKIQSSSKSEFNLGGVLFTKDLDIRSGNLKSNAVGLLVATGYTKIVASAKTTQGLLDICDENGIEELDTSNLLSFLFCQTEITKNGCIQKGFSVTPPSSGLDPEIFFAYPSSGYAFRAFEDLWPSQGDYDFNDAVIRYKLNFAANRNNHIISVEAEISINAIGGSIQNALALQFLHADKSRYTGTIFSSIDGEFAEIDAADPSVVVLNTNIIENLPSYYNNLGEGRDAEPLVFNVILNIDPAAQISSSDFLADVFIFRVADRGLEIHMPNMPPSAGANTAYLNTFEDNSDESGFYKTTEQYPWALELTSLNTFQHPRSKINITEAYPKFDLWVKSGGVQELEWYKSPNMLLVY